MRWLLGGERRGGNQQESDETAWMFRDGVMEGSATACHPERSEGSVRATGGTESRGGPPR